jgi:protein-S-isoprenylcysteine O-methyltransferase Ste14
MGGTTDSVLKILSVIGYIIILISILVLCSIRSIFATAPILITIQVLTFMLMIWARITFGRRSFHLAANPTDGGLVTTGPYKWIRHPIYAAIFYFILAAACSHGTILTIMVACIACAGIAMRIYAEEKLIVMEYPEYAEYASRTKRILPYIF